MSDQPDTEPDPLRTYVEIPEGGVVVGVIEVAHFLAPDGENSYAFRFPGDLTYSNILGLLELTKAQVIASYFSDTKPPDDE